MSRCRVQSAPQFALHCITVLCCSLQWLVESMNDVLLSCRSSSDIYQEAGEGRVKLPEEDPEIISRVIGFIYTNDYDWTEVPDVFLSRKTRRIATTAPSGDVNGQTLHGHAEGTSGSSAQNSETQSDFVESLHIHIWMYKCADFLGIENLKQKAAERFYILAKEYFAHEAFAKPLRSMFESTKSGDIDLRRKTMELCVVKYAQIEVKKDTLAVILEHEANTWSVAVPLLKEIVETSKKKLQKLQKAVNNLTVTVCSRSTPSYYTNGPMKIVVEKNLSLTVLYQSCSNKT